MTKIQKLLTSGLLLALTLLSTSCSKHDDDIKLSPIRGFYRIFRINAETPINVNNFGENNDLVSGYRYFFPNGRQDSRMLVYDINDPRFFMRVKPFNDDKGRYNAKNLIDFNIPIPEAGIKSGTPYIGEFKYGFNNYEYKLASNGIDITIEKKDNNSDKQYGEIISVQQKSKNAIDVKAKLRLFDFTKKDYITTLVTIEYVKVGDIWDDLYKEVNM
ncbi:hypothetical protein [Porphyromonas pogonae]|uniref:hypothetical protein n=1 Tax=Porphyromonas pogonae TaxID=867595 RepID=UPI002E76917D|nr:hypothetical protein [Porphyromonas pogonae]